jgi:hypothetical protein
MGGREEGSREVRGGRGGKGRLPIEEDGRRLGKMRPVSVGRSGDLSRRLGCAYLAART